MPPGQIQRIIHDTPAYQKADNIKKGFYDYHAFYKNSSYGWQVECTLDNTTGDSQIKIKFPYNGLDHEITINRDGTSASATQGGKKVKPDAYFDKANTKLLQALFEKFPDNAQALDNMAKSALPFLYIDNRGQTKNTLIPPPPKKASKQPDKAGPPPRGRATPRRIRKNPLF